MPGAKPFHSKLYQNPFKLCLQSYLILRLGEGARPIHDGNLIKSSAIQWRVEREENKMSVANAELCMLGISGSM